MMTRTQIYLSEAEASGLKAIADHTGRTQSDLIREAVDALIARYRSSDRLALLRRARGIWEDRDEEEFELIRREFDRYGPNAS